MTKEKMACVTQAIDEDGKKVLLCFRSNNSEKF